MTEREKPIVFFCAGEALVGILHAAAETNRIGVVIAVGGPQYRAGSHRQFVDLARFLAAAGIAVLRFDYRGMGDSGGTWRGIDNVEDDLHAAIDALLGAGLGVERVVLWGLCDAASALMLHAHTDDRVAGLVLLNPWVRTDTTFARTQIRHYYLKRLADRVFWRRLLTGEVAVRAALADAARAVRKATARTGGRAAVGRPGPIPRHLPLPERMALGLDAWRGPVLLILSGNDLTAREFEDAAASSPLWRRLLSDPRIVRRDLPEADHTFSRRAWKETVAIWTRDWLATL